MNLRNIVVGLFVCGLIIALPVNAMNAPAPEATVIANANTSTSTSTSTTSTTVIVASFDARCPQWWATARAVGFDDTLMSTLDRVMFRESRCDPTQLNADDPNGGSVGLVQINQFWCIPSTYYPSGYLQTMGVLTSCDQLFDPTINLRAALELVAYSRSVGLCAWQQWAWVETPCQIDGEGA
jgi:hypothetical protein